MTNLERYMYYAKCVESTDLYREWSFYSLIAACLQRRYYTSDDEEWSIFGNHYIIFVGDPGSGKDNAMRIHSRILDRINEAYKIKTGKIFDPTNPYDHELIHQAPDSVTVEQLIRRMSLLSDGYIDHNNPLKACFQSAVTFCCSELENLFKTDDLNLSGFFKVAWDCGKQFIKETKTQKHDVIQFPCVNMLAGTTPEWISKGMAFGLLNDGFLGRALFVAGGKPSEKVTFFIPTEDQKRELQVVYEHCLKLCGLEKGPKRTGGLVPLSKEAKEFLEYWYHNEFKHTNPEIKLKHYYARKKALVIKQALIYRFSDSTDITEITVEDMKNGLASLDRVEINMHLALATAGKNPIHMLANNIFNFLKEKNRFYSKEILGVIFHAEAQEEEITKAINYLQSAKKILLGVDVTNNNMIGFRANPAFKEES